MKNKFLISTAIPFASMLTACSASAPDAKDIEAALLQNAEPCKEYFKISNVKKTNGIAQNNGYQVSYTYSVTILPKLIEITKPGADSLGTKALLMASCDGGVYQLLVQREPIQVNQTVEMEGKATMVKSEKGWVAGV